MAKCLRFWNVCVQETTNACWAAGLAHSPRYQEAVLTALNARESYEHKALVFRALLHACQSVTDVALFADKRGLYPLAAVGHRL